MTIQLCAFTFCTTILIQKMMAAAFIYAQFFCGSNRIFNASTIIIGVIWNVDKQEILASIILIIRNNSKINVSFSKSKTNV